MHENDPVANLLEMWELPAVVQYGLLRGLSECPDSNADSAIASAEASKTESKDHEPKSRYLPPI